MEIDNNNWDLSTVFFRWKRSITGVTLWQFPILIQEVKDENQP